ncbi:FAD-binding oxidoreductase [Vreelandella rituensis]|uniref:FAD-binding oxidoreductase n=1 Tax=Vreelandella rituensis TaxID=2282306 RepID=UPI001F328044|nr:FAD-dependent oxidoreductase [Halomonas rituensis]
MSQLSQTAIKEFKADFAGSVILPEDPQYDEVRQIWNAMIDRRPSMITRCTSPADVVHSLNFVRQHNLPFSIRGGGHNIAGNAVCDDGVMIDLSLMKKVDIDQELHRGYVEPGCTLADFDTAAQAHGLATPLAVCRIKGRESQKQRPFVGFSAG